MPTSLVGRIRLSRESGVTLIEMLVVVMIIALFSAIVGPELFKKLEMSKVTAARVQIHNFTSALGQHKLAMGEFPTTGQGLQALRAAPQGVDRWAGRTCRSRFRSIRGITRIFTSIPPSMAMSRTS